MQDLFNKAFQELAVPKIRNSPEMIHRMMGRHICPCCSDTLLRHIRWGGIYWRCSYCYQEMPVL
jgi:ribosomal protein L37AE/L43A